MSPKIQFVDHRGIFPDPEVLPVRNSRAIESCVYRIPEPSERLINFNDDVMVVKPVPAGKFLQANRAARFFPRTPTSDMVRNDHAPHLQAARNDRRLLGRDFGFEIANTTPSTPHPHVRVY